MPDQIQLLSVFKYVNFHGVGIKKIAKFYSSNQCGFEGRYSY